MITLSKLPSRNFFMDGGPFGAESPSLGFFGELVTIATGLLSAFPAAAATYQAKRAADRAKQDRKRRNEEEAAASAAEAEAQAKAQEAAKQAMVEQGLTPQGTPLPNQKILGLDPMVLAVGGIGIVGIGVAIYMAMKK